MNIELHQVSIRDVVKGYIDNAEEGVLGYDGKLNIRPPFQREFIYKDKQRNAVIETIRKGFPLNTLYWSHNPSNDTYELLDGQQRTISICQYVQNDFSVGNRYFHNLTAEERELILDYKLMIYFCEGTEAEKLDWFNVINISGEKLTDQELRNAVYTGPWLSDAKRYFSKTQCPAYQIGSGYLKGSPIRQEYLEKVLKWLTNGRIEEYMAKYQHSPNANELWLYFQSVINWVKTVFPTYRKEMKDVEWGELFNEFAQRPLDSVSLDKEVARLMADEDVTKKSGIYAYLLTGAEKYLNIRAFLPRDKRTAYEKQNGVCAICQKHFDFDKMEADHITPWHKGGKTISENCKMLCVECNRRKSGK